jgi:hypothetical protein
VIPRGWLIAGVAVGIVFAVTFTLSPLTLLAVVALALVFKMAAAGLGRDEARALWTLLLAASAIRIAAVAVMFLVGEHDTQAATLLTGDEAYALARTTRLRHILLGVPALKHDYIIAFEEYGVSSYLSLIALLQLVFGPAPYGLRLVNMFLFLSAAVLLFRFARAAFGPVPAYVALALVLFLPTLFFWSIAILKESLYFALAMTVMTAVYAVARTSRHTTRVLAAVAAVLALVAMRDLRPGAIVLVGGGALFGVVLWIATATLRRFAVTSALAVVVGAALLMAAPVRDRVRAGLAQTAQMQIGHVFTVGHAYKTLDEGFYVKWYGDTTLTDGEAARYVIRSIASFLIEPLPWHMTTRSELIFLPEHMLWYVAMPVALIGIAAGLRRERLATCLLIGLIVPTAMVVALTNGNVGTLIRFRGLVWPYIIVLSALGGCVLLQHLVGRDRRFSELAQIAQRSMLARVAGGSSRVLAHAWHQSRARTSMRPLTDAASTNPSLPVKAAGVALLTFVIATSLVASALPRTVAPAMPAAFWLVPAAAAVLLLARSSLFTPAAKQPGHADR